MPKFYVRWGSFEFLTTADDAWSAALWAVHCYTPVLAETESAPANAGIVKQSLESIITVSEIGFSYQEVAVFDTRDVVLQWILLDTAVANMVCDGIHGEVR